MCLKPLTAWQHTKDGGQPVFKKPLTPIHYTPLKLKCNNCSDCLKNRKTEWSLRLLHESYQYEHNQFITLTYDDENLPAHNHLIYKDYQDFMKRLRKAYPASVIRFAVSSEYGEKFGRPHFHAIIYNLYLPDLDQVGKSSGHPIYESPNITKIWGKGAVKIGEVNRETCMYVAKYMTKKDVSKWDGIDHETGEIIAEFNDKGEIYRIPPRHRYSTHPGIGHDFAKKWYKDFIPSGFIVHDGKKYPVPDYYLTVAERYYPELALIIAEMKIERMKALKTEQFKANNTLQRLKSRIKYNDAIEKRYKFNKEINQNT